MVNNSARNQSGVIMKPVDFPFWDHDEAMEELGDDEEFLMEMLEDCRQQTEAELVNIRKLLAQIKAGESSSNSEQVYEAVRDLAELTHKLKGSYEIICCKDMFSTCKTLHLCAKDYKQNMEQGSFPFSNSILAALEPIFRAYDETCKVMLTICDESL